MVFIILNIKRQRCVKMLNFKFRKLKNYSVLCSSLSLLSDSFRHVLPVTLNWCVGLSLSCNVGTGWHYVFIMVSTDVSVYWRQHNSQCLACTLAGGSSVLTRVKSHTFFFSFWLFGWLLCPIPNISTTRLQCCLNVVKHQYKTSRIYW